MGLASLQHPLLLALYCVSFVSATPIDNGVEGDPEIECAATSITVNFNTRNDFNGHVYVKGRFSEPGCKSDEGGRRVAGIKLGFDQCGTQRSRSLNPKGVFVSTTVVITFHPQFLTKVDRAYTVQCFYMEADKTVSQDLEVSEITTAFQTQTVPMPVCEYNILDGGPEGQPVQFATIGQQLYHKWTCTTETTDIFCAVVHSCFVDDGAGNHQPLLDENGCSIDKFLLQNLEYPSDLMAGREAHVFKYADKPALFFQCQVTISIKEPGQQCARPQCGEPGSPLRPSGGSVPAPPPGTRGSVPPRPVSPRPGTAPPQPPRGGSSPRPSVAIAGPLGGRGLFLAPLQSLLASSSVTAPSLSRPPVPVNGSIPPQGAPVQSLQSRPPPPLPGASLPPPSGSLPPRPPPPATLGPLSLGSIAPISPLAGGTQPPRPIGGPRVPNAIDPDQLNVPSNLGPGPGIESGGFDFPDRRRRAKRSPAAVSSEAVAGTWDLRAQPITALDIDDDILDDSLRRRLSPNRNGSPEQARLEKRQSEQQFCLSPVSFGLFLAFVIAFSIFSVMVGVFYCLRRSSK